MKNLCLVFMMIFCGGIAKAQLTTYPMLTAGYQYQNSHFAELGGTLLMLKNDDFIYRIGASALLGGVNDQVAIIPKLQGDVLINTQKNVDVHHAYYVLAGAEATPHYIAPKVGLSLFGIVDFTGGYAFSYDKNGIHGKELKGINFNFTVHIPLVVFSK